MKEWYKIVNQSGVPVITIYGVITPDSDDEDAVSYAQFQAAFRDLERVNTECSILLNCMGGSMIEGFPMYDMVKNSPMNVTMVVEGTAASFAAVFLQAGDTRKMNANAFVMVHAAAGGTYGNSVTLRNYADTMDTMQSRAKAILLERTGQPESVVDGWLTPGVDTWLTAEQCLEFNLVDEIVPAASKRVVIPVANLAKRKPVDAYHYINNQLNFEKTDMSKLKTSLVMLLMSTGVKLSIDDSDEKFADEVEKFFKAKNDAISKIAKDNAIAIVAQSGLTFSDSEKEDLIGYGATNPAGLVVMLGKIKPAPAVQALPSSTTIVNLNGGLGKQTAPADDRENWNFNDWSKKDSKGLIAMQASDPEKFNKLVAGVSADLVERGII